MGQDLSDKIDKDGLQEIFEIVRYFPNEQQMEHRISLAGAALFAEFRDELQLPFEAEKAFMLGSSPAVLRAARRALQDHAGTAVSNTRRPLPPTTHQGSRSNRVMICLS